MIAGPSRLVLLGNPVSHSLSPVFQNAALKSEGIPLTYEAIEVAAPDLGHVLTLLAEDNAAGNITIPHKEAAFALCARRSPLAERVGAVNTFWIEEDGADGGVLVGDNTDVGGFESLVRATMEQWAAFGARAALTGPIARGDEDTVTRQRAAVADAAPDMLALWDALAAATRDLAAAPIAIRS